MKSFFNKKNFQEDHMLAMIPTQLTFTKESMSSSLKEMYANLNYYYKLTGPLHNHKTYDRQLLQIEEVSGNLTALSQMMEEIKGGIGGYEGGLHDRANDYIAMGDHYARMSPEDKDNLFEEATVEFEKSLQLALKKFSVMKTKVTEIQNIMHEFRSWTDRLESLYMKDVDQRKQYYLDHPSLGGGRSRDFAQPAPNVDYDAIHKIFDEIEREESRSTIGILFNLSNILMMTVIGFSAFLFLKVDQGGRNKRLD